MYWKEAWLKRAPFEQASNAPAVMRRQRQRPQDSVDGAAADTLNGFAVAQRDCALLEPTVYHLEFDAGRRPLPLPGDRGGQASCPLPWCGTK